MRVVLCLILLLVTRAPVGVLAQGAAEESIPEVTLAEALRRAAVVDPDYVASLRRVGDAAWARRAAYTAFVLPSIQFQSTATRFSNEIFNVGTGENTKEIVEARVEAQYDIFRGGARFHDLGRARAELRSANAGEIEMRMQTAVETEADYYDAIAQEELTRVAAERVRRAEEQLEVARARVVSGAAVHSDSLQLVLELTRARVDLLGQESSRRVAWYQLGRRIGSDGPVRPAPLPELPAPELPVTEDEALREARTTSPRIVQAEADAQAAQAGYRAAWAAYLPRLSWFGQFTGFDDNFFPTATVRGLTGLSLTFPIWNQAQREIELSRASGERAVAEAARDDERRAVGRDVVEAYQNYATARASAELAAQAVGVAQENLRVQQERYRAGATTIIDLITAQVDLADAEVGLVQARHATRLALAGLESILGRRLFQPEGGTS